MTYLRSCRLSACVIAALLVIPWASFAQPTNAVDSLQTKYETQRQKIDAEALAAYSNVLVTVGNQLKQKADLAGYTILKAEQRFIAEKQVLPEGPDRTNLVGKLPGLDAPLSKIEASRNAKIANLLKQYIPALAAQVRQLMIAEKLDEAAPLQNAMEAAKTELAELESKTAPIKAQPGTSPQPTSALLWRDLKKEKVAEASGSKWLSNTLDTDRPIAGEPFNPHQDIYEHASSQVVYDFKKPIREFRATILLADGANEGNVIFKVSTDEGVIFKSKPITIGTRKTLNLNFKPSRRLILITDENGSDRYDWAVWLHPQVR